MRTRRSPHAPSFMLAAFDAIAPARHEQEKEEHPCQCSQHYPSNQAPVCAIHVGHRLANKHIEAPGTSRFLCAHLSRPTSRPAHHQTGHGSGNAAESARPLERGGGTRRKAAGSARQRRQRRHRYWRESPTSRPCGCEWRPSQPPLKAACARERALRCARRVLATPMQKLLGART